MSRPTLRANAGIYTLVWEQEKISVRIDRLREDGHNNVTGEILVQTLLPATPSHLHQARLNLTSTAARRTLATQLRERIEEPDWTMIVEQACVLVLQKHREGEPAIDLKDMPAPEGPHYRLEPLLPEGHPSLIFGAGGVGKSLLALYFAVLVSSGYQWHNLIAMPGRVLFLDFETSGSELRERAIAIEAGLRDPGGSDIVYRFCVQPLANDIEQIQRIVSDRQIELVIIDSLGPACGGNPNDSEPVIAYFRALRSLRITTLTIDHPAKNATTATPYGSVYKLNLSRSVFELRKEQEPGEDAMRLGLFHRKTNFGKLLPPIGLHVAFTPTSITFSPCAVRDVPELAEGMSTRQRIEDLLLAAGPLKVSEMAEELDVSQASVRRTLNRFKGRTFTRLTGGPEASWAMATSEEFQRTAQGA